jgi:pimeloyl-ACP methyl ester carboxylesterase
MPIPTLPGITAKTITTPRITTRVLFSGTDDGIPVLFLHGNASSATFWEEIMTMLPTGYRGIAPDQRAYGDSDRVKKIDSTRGLGDLADDTIALLDHLGLDKVHVAGHSLGGSVVWRLLADYPSRFLTVTVVCPGSPYGYGGSKDVDGTPTYADFAGSGGGTVNAGFAQRMSEGDRSMDNPQSAPRAVMNGFYWKQGFVAPREEDLLSSLLAAHVGGQDYPGDHVASTNWPFVAPGVFGPTNALSPKYVGDSVQRLINTSPKPPILWVRGSHDVIISDESLLEFGTLGKLGYVPGWPGMDVYPPQPMVSQTRAVMEKYAANGGAYREIVMQDTGHSPFIERPDEFNGYFLAHIGAN